jgi:hypothetical protein
MKSPAQVEDYSRVLVVKPEGKNNWKDLEVGGRIILRWILGN